jgi:hypothetical protein
MDVWRPSAGEDATGPDLETRDDGGRTFVDDDLDPNLVHAKFFRRDGHTFVRLTVSIDLAAKFQLSFGALTAPTGDGSAFGVQVRLTRKLDYPLLGRPYIATDYRAYYDLGPTVPGPHGLTVSRPDGTVVKQFDFTD